MKLRVMAMTLAIVATAFGSALAQSGGTIGIFADNMGTSCDITTTLYVQTEFFILANPNTANTAGGVNGAEFRIVGDPSTGGIVTAVANPASNVALGNPFEIAANPPGSKGGCNIAFPTCQLPDAQGFVLLYTVQYFPTAVVSVDMQVDRADPPSNPSLANCPLINACDAPVFTAVCAVGGRAYMNPTVPGAACTEVAVQENTWSEVKSLYSN